MITDKVKCNDCGKTSYVVVGAEICPVCYSHGTLEDSKPGTIESSNVDRPVFLIDKHKLRAILSASFVKTLDEVMMITFGKLPDGEYAEKEFLKKLMFMHPTRNKNGESIMSSDALVYKDVLDDESFYTDVRNDEKDTFYFSPEYLSRVEGAEFKIIDPEKERPVIVDADFVYSIGLLRKMKKKHGWDVPLKLLLDFDRTESYKLNFAMGTGLVRKLRLLQIYHKVETGRSKKEIYSGYR